MAEGHELVTIASSNLPADAKKSALMRAWEGIKGGGIKRVESHAVEVGHGVRAGGESLLIGGALGLIHAHKGLDLPNGTPLDGALGAAGLIAAVAFPSVAPDLRQVGATSLGILAFRKVHDWQHEQNLAKGDAKGTKIAKPATPSTDGGAKVAGEFAGDDDPIVELAKSL
jgi:hypothetical protein